MSRARGDESDEEVYLSEPDTDDASSVGDYENANDTHLETGHDAAEPSTQDEIDYALHDAEVERANVRPSALPAKPETVIPPASSMLSADAKPWVPPGYDTAKPTDSAAQATVPQAKPAGSEDVETTRTTVVVDPPVRSLEQDEEKEEQPAKKEESHSETKPAANGRKEVDQEVVFESPMKAEVTLPETAALSSEEPAFQDEADKKEKEDEKKEAEENQTEESPEPSAVNKTEVTETEEIETPEVPESEIIPVEDSAPSATPTHLNGEGDSELESAPSAPTHLNGEGNKDTESARSQAGGLNGSGGEKSTGEAVHESPAEVKELAAELPSTAAAAPAPSLSEATGESEPRDKQEETEDKENTEPLKADDEEVKVVESEVKTPAGSSEAEKPSAGPSLPPRPQSAAPKGLGGGLGRSLPPRGLSALPSRPARTASGETPKRTEDQKAEGTETRSIPTEDESSKPASSSAPTASASTTGAAGGAQPSTQVPNNGQTRSAAPSLPVRRPVPVTRQPAPAPAAPADTPPESEKVQKVRATLQHLRVQLHRIGRRLNYQDHNIVRTIEYRLSHAERIRLGSSQDKDCKAEAERLERENSEETLYSMTVMVIGLTGVGKSALINSLLGHEAVSADAFEGTTSVHKVTSTQFGLNLTLIDTPGLSAAAGAVSHNKKVLKAIDKARKQYKPDLVIYAERMDMLRRDLSDLPVLRKVTETLGSEVWFNTLIVITHATAKLVSPRGDTFPFDQSSQTRAAMFQRALQAVVGDPRISVPTTFAENDPNCPKDSQGEPILPNDLTWRKFIFMYLASIKILREADNELQSTSEGKKDNAMSQLSMLLQAQRGVKLPPLPFLITNMIKHAGPKQYPQGEQDIKREDEIKAIKRFGPRRKEFRKRTEFLKNKQAERRMIALGKESDEPEIDPYEPPNQGPPLGPTFDSDEQSLYYRAYEPKAGEGGWLTRPRLEQNMVDHTDGVESLTTERSFVKRGKGKDLDGIPISAHAIIQKDKFSQLFQGGAEGSLYQNYRLVHTARGQVMTLSGGDILYISQLESQLSYIPRNRLTLGGMVSRLSEADSFLPFKGKVALGLKLENDFDLPENTQYNLKNNIKAGIGRGLIRLGQGRKEQATGMNAEWQLTGGARENVQVMGSFSQMQYRGNKGRQYALSANVPVTDETTLSPKIQLQSGQGSLTIRCASHDHSNLGLVVFLPLAKAFWDKLRNKAPQQQDQLSFL